MKPVNLNLQIGEKRVRGEGDEPPNSNEYVSLPESPNKEQVQRFSDCNSDSDSEEEVDNALEAAMNIIRPTGQGTVRKLTSSMADFFQT